MLARKLRTLLRLDTSKRALAVESLVLPLVIRAAFFFAGVPRTQAAVERYLSSHPVRNTHGCREEIAAVVRLQKLVNRSTGTGGTCLVRSLSLWASLRRRGVMTDLRIGVRKRNGVTEGHAWLELDGQPINESKQTAATYVRFEVSSNAANRET